MPRQRNTVFGDRKAGRQEGSRRGVLLRFSDRAVTRRFGPPSHNNLWYRCFRLGHYQIALHPDNCCLKNRTPGDPDCQASNCARRQSIHSADIRCNHPIRFMHRNSMEEGRTRSLRWPLACLQKGHGTAASVGA